jgi:hypothetical protein
MLVLTPLWQLVCQELIIDTIMLCYVVASARESAYGETERDGRYYSIRAPAGGGPGGGCARRPVGIPSPPRGGRWKPRSRARLGMVGG